MNEGDHSVGRTTGHRGIDEAMAAVGALADADLATHVATFERAHDVLRSALTSPTEVPNGEDASPTAQA